MPLTVINDSLNPRWIYYRVGGMSKKMWFQPNETRTIPDINSMESLMNAVSLRKYEIAERLPEFNLTKDLFDIGGNYFREITQDSCSIFVVPNTKSIQFNDSETNQTVQVPYNAAQDIGTSDYTLSMWVKMPSSATTDQAIYWQRNTVNNSGINATWLNKDGGRVKFQFTKNTGSPTISFTANGILNDGQWRHIAITNDRDVGVRVYVDGVNGFLDVAAVPFSGFNLTHATQPIVIGNSTVPSIPLKGQVDEVILMKRALSESQMTSLYNCGEAINPISAFGDVALWLRMGDGDTFPTVTDQSGNEDGTMTNMSAGDIKDDTSQNPV